MTEGPAYDGDVPGELPACPADGMPVKSRSEDPDPFVGRTVHGRYRITRKLRQEDIAAVYLAEHVLVKRSVALWVLDEDAAHDRTALVTFRHDVRAIGRLDPRHIAMVHDLDETEDGHLFVVMEHPEGRTLEEVLREEGALPADRTLALAIQIAEALRAAHGAGVTHGHLTPQAVVLSPDDMVKLTDFLATRLRDVAGAAPAAADGPPGASRHHVAPEGLRGERTAEAEDIYALGVVLYGMLTGERPAGETTAGAPGASIRARETAPESLLDVIGAMLHTDPARRPPTMAEVLRQLRIVRAAADDATRVLVLPESEAPLPREVPPAVDRSDPASPGPPSAVLPAGPHATEPPAPPERLAVTESPPARNRAGSRRFLRDLSVRAGTRARTRRFMQELRAAAAQARAATRERRVRFVALGIAAIAATSVALAVGMRPPRSERVVSSPAGPVTDGTSVPNTPAGSGAGSRDHEPRVEPAPVRVPDSPPGSPPAVPVSDPRGPGDGTPEAPGASSSTIEPERSRNRPATPDTPAATSIAPPPAGGRTSGAPAPRPGTRPQTPGARPPRAGPEETRALVQQKLQKSNLLREHAGVSGVSVDVGADGIVTLTGIVDTRDDRERAIALARETPGVTSVRPRVNVRESWQKGS